MESEVTKNRNADLDFTGDWIYVGIDVHKKQWNVSIMGDFKEHKTFVQPPDATKLGNYLRTNFPNADYYSVYEAGFSGFWAHEDLRKEGITNMSSMLPMSQPPIKRSSRNATASIAGNSVAPYAKVV